MIFVGSFDSIQVLISIVELVINFDVPKVFAVALFKNPTN